MKKLMAAPLVAIALIAVVGTIYIAWQPPSFLAEKRSPPAGTEGTDIHKAALPIPTNELTESPKPMATPTPATDVFSSSDIPEDVQTLMLGKTNFR